MKTETTTRKPKITTRLLKLTPFLSRTFFFSPAWREFQQCHNLLVGGCYVFTAGKKTQMLHG